MVAIVSGNSLGLSLTSLATLGQTGTGGSATVGANGEQAFVNLANGNLVLQHLDDQLVVHGTDIAAVRTYNSQGKITGGVQDSWAVGAARQRLLQLPATFGAVDAHPIRVDSDGAEAAYDWDNAGFYVTTDGAGAYDKLTWDATYSQYAWTDGDTGVVERYDASGRLVSSTDRDGNKLEFGYDASGRLAKVTRANLDVVSYTYNLTSGDLDSVTTGLVGGPTSTRVRYEYDTHEPRHRLIAVSVDLTPDDNSVADGKVYRTTYTYDGDSQRVASITQPDGSTTSITYVLVDGVFKVGCVTDGLQQLTSYGYDSVNHRTTVIDPVGLTTIYQYDDEGQLVRIEAGSVRAANASASTYALTVAAVVVTSTTVNGVTYLSWPKPAAGTAVEWRYRPAGGTDDQWQQVAVTNPGDGTLKVALPMAVAGAYEYELLHTPGGSFFPSACARGVFTAIIAVADYIESRDTTLQPVTVELVSDPLNATAQMLWSAPSASTTTVWRYRLAGSGAVYQSLPVQVANGKQFVNLTGIAAGTYEFDLLETDMALTAPTPWTQGMPVAHAMGTLVLNATVPEHYITRPVVKITPELNASGQPRLSWEPPPEGTASTWRYKDAAGEWRSVPVVADAATGKLTVNLVGIAAGSYHYEMAQTGTTTFTYEGDVEILPQVPAHAETRLVPVATFDVIASNGDLMWPVGGSAEATTFRYRVAGSGEQGWTTYTGTFDYTSDGYKKIRGDRLVKDQWFEFEVLKGPGGQPIAHAAGMFYAANTMQVKNGQVGRREDGTYSVFGATPPFYTAVTQVPAAWVAPRHVSTVVTPELGATGQPQMSWDAPASGVTTTWRYKNEAGQWQNVAPSLDAASGKQFVSLAGIAAGSYQYEMVQAIGATTLVTVTGSVDIPATVAAHTEIQTVPVALLALTVTDTAFGWTSGTNGVASTFRYRVPGSGEAGWVTYNGPFSYTTDPKTLDNLKSIPVASIPKVSNGNWTEFEIVQVSANGSPVAYSTGMYTGGGGSKATVNVGLVGRREDGVYAIFGPVPTTRTGSVSVPAVTQAPRAVATTVTAGLSAAGLPQLAWDRPVAGTTTTWRYQDASGQWQYKALTVDAANGKQVVNLAEVPAGSYAYEVAHTLGGVTTTVSGKVDIPAGVPARTETKAVDVGVIGVTLNNNNALCWVSGTDWGTTTFRYRIPGSGDAGWVTYTGAFVYVTDNQGPDTYKGIANQVLPERNKWVEFEVTSVPAGGGLPKAYATGMYYTTGAGTPQYRVGQVGQLENGTWGITGPTAPTRTRQVTVPAVVAAPRALTSAVAMGLGATGQSQVSWDAPAAGTTRDWQYKNATGTWTSVASTLDAATGKQVANVASVPAGSYQYRLLESGSVIAEGGIELLPAAASRTETQQVPVGVIDVTVANSAMSWPAGATGTTTTLRYRINGEQTWRAYTGAYTYTTDSKNLGVKSIAASALPGRVSGNWVEFEILQTPAGATEPSSHATGIYSGSGDNNPDLKLGQVAWGESGYYVITGPTTSSRSVQVTVAGAVPAPREIGTLIAASLNAGGQPQLSWDMPALGTTTSWQYKNVAGEWQSLALTADSATGKQIVNLASLPAGIYEYKLVQGGTTTATVAGRVEVLATVAAHAETQQVPVAIIPVTHDNNYGLKWIGATGGATTSFRHRQLGTTTWTTYSGAFIYKDGYKSIPFASLVNSTTMEFEILQTPAGGGNPTAHATGTYKYSGGTMTLQLGQVGFLENSTWGLLGPTPATRPVQVNVPVATPTPRLLAALPPPVGAPGAPGTEQVLVRAYTRAPTTTATTTAKRPVEFWVPPVMAISSTGVTPGTTVNVALDGGRLVRTIGYNNNGDVIEIKNGAGETTSFEYVNGNQTVQRDALGNTVQRTYNEYNQLKSETIAGLTANYLYNSDDPNFQSAHPELLPPRRLRFAISAQGRLTQYLYNSFGERSSALVYEKTYPKDDPRTFVAILAWAAGQESDDINRTDMGYDARGQLQTTTVFARLDAVSRAGVYDGTESTTTFTRDGQGNLIGAIDANEVSTTYVYDGLGRLTLSTGALGQRTETLYDDAGGRVTTTLVNGLATVRSYDRAGRLASEAQSATGLPDLGTTRFSYDADNRLVMTTDPTGVRAFILYDVQGRKSASIDGNGSLTEYRYDAADRLTRIIQYSGFVDLSELVDAGGNPINPRLETVNHQARPEDRSSWRIYDAAGRLFKTVDAEGAVVEYTYDGASRVVFTRQYATRLGSTSALGDQPQSASAAPANHLDDRVTRNIYDLDGLLRGTLDAEGYLVEFVHDGAGRLTRTLRYANLTTPALRETANIVSLKPAANSDNDEVTTYLRNEKGQVAGEIDAEGYLTTYTYDLVGRVTASKRYATKVGVSYTTSTSVANVIPATNGEDRTSTWTYDDLGRCIEEKNAEGTKTLHTYDAASNRIASLTAVDTTEARVTLKVRFDVQGRLVGELTAQGAALLDAAVDPEAVWRDHGITHKYDAAGRRVSTTDQYGNRKLFFYDEDGRLTHTVDPLGGVVAATYDALGNRTADIRYAKVISTANLTGDKAGGLVNSTLRNAIDAIDSATKDGRTDYRYTRAGQVDKITNALAQATYITRNAFGEEESRTSATNVVTKTQRDHRGLQIGSTVDVAGLDIVTSVEYDAFGRVYRVVDGNGKTTTYDNDRLGRALSVTDPLNIKRSTTYDAFSRVTSQTDGMNRVTKYEYSKASSTLTITTPELIDVVTTYNRHGQVVSVRDGRAITTSYTYDSDGRLTGSSRAGVFTGSNEYDRAGRVSVQVDAAGTVVKLSYDAAGRVESRTLDPTAVNTAVRYSYDVDGNLVTTTYDPVELNLVTHYTYDSQGRQLTVEEPNGNVTKYTYDREGRLETQAVDPNGLNLETEYEYDADGRTITVTSPNGSRTRYEYDNAGRRVEESVEGTGFNLRRRYTYDDNGNVVSARDGNESFTYYRYDASNRLVLTVNAAGGVQENIYDNAGRVTRTVTYAKTVSGVNAATTLEQIRPLIDPDPTDAVENRVYDKDGRLTATVNGLGEVVRFVYDKNGNVKDRTAYATRLTGWVTGNAVNPTSDPAHDRRTQTLYDNFDRAIYSVDGTGAVVTQTYDGNGNVKERTAYAKKIDPAAFNGVAILPITSGPDAKVRNVYDAAGRLAWSVDGVGSVVQRLYDGAGNVTQLVQYATRIDPSTDLSAVAPSISDRITSFAYDKAGRQTFAVDSLGGLTETVYDANGNVTQSVRYSKRTAQPVLGVALASADLAAFRNANKDSDQDRITRMAWDAANRLVFTIDAAGAVVENQYDGAGNITKTIARARIISANKLASLSSTATANQVKGEVADSDLDRFTERTFDGAGQVATTEDGAGLVTTYTRDGVGRVKDAVESDDVEATADRVTSFTYDAAGRVLTSTDAMLGKELYAYDGVGNRKEFTNKNEDKWKYEYDAAGRMIEETAPPVAVMTMSTDGGVTWAPTTTYDVSLVTGMVYDGLGNLMSRTEAKGRVGESRTTSYFYDALGRQTLVKFPPVGVYNPADDLTSGAEGNAARKETTQALYAQITYDALGNAVSNRDVGGYTSTKIYDRLGNVTCEQDADHHVTGYGRNTFGDAVTLTRYYQGPGASDLPDAQADKDRTITTEFDRMGRAVKVTEPVAFVFDADATSESSRYYYAGKTTKNTYNAFGEVSQVERLKNAIKDTWIRESRYYDAAGRLIETVDAGGYATKLGYDAQGNLTERIEYAKAISNWGSGTAPSEPPTPGLDASNDRTTRYTYDACNRKTSETRVSVEYSDAADAALTVHDGDVTTHYSYDAVGNVVSVQDALGGLTRTYYDPLGRIRAVAQPVRPAETTFGIVTPLTAFSRDAFGNVVQQVEYAAGAATATNDDYTANNNTDNRITYTHYDAMGRALRTRDAQEYDHYMSYDAFGHVAKQWETVTGGTTTQVMFRAFRYDALGRLISSIEPASTNAMVDGVLKESLSQAEVGVVTTDYMYNPFGEIIVRRLNGQSLDQNDYDIAGRLWHTDSGDGIDKIYFYDLLGNVTADIRSARESLDGGEHSLENLLNFATREDDLRRVDMSYDALGRVVKQTLAAREEKYSEVVVRDTHITAATTSSTRDWVIDSEGAHWAWAGANSVALSWDDLSTLGAGEVKVEIEYLTLRHTTMTAEDGGVVWVAVEGVPRTQAIIVRSPAGDEGAVLTWNDLDPISDYGGILRVTKATVLKKDVNGNWVRVMEQHDVARISVPQGGSNFTTAAQGAGTTWQGYNSVAVDFESMISVPVGTTFDVEIEYYQKQAVQQPDGTITYTQGARATRIESHTTEEVFDGVHTHNFFWQDPPGLNGGLFTVTRFRVLTRGMPPLAMMDISRPNTAGFSDYLGNVIEVERPINATKVRLEACDVYTNGSWFTVAVTGSNLAPVPIADFGSKWRIDTSALDPHRYKFRLIEQLPGESESVLVEDMLSRTRDYEGDEELLRPVVNRNVDRWGNVTSISDPRSASWITTYQYNANNQLVLQTQPAGAAPAVAPQTRYHFDKLGRQIGVEDANHHVNRQEFDSQGNVVKEIHADGGVITHAYNAFGEVKLTIDAEHNHTEFVYNKLGWQTEVHHKGENRGGFQVYGAQRVGDRLSLTNNGAAVHVTELVDSTGWDSLGRKISQTNGAGEKTRYEYDLRGNIIKTTKPDNTVSSKAAFDALGHKVGEVDGNNSLSTWKYDGYKLLKYFDTAGTLYDYKFDRAGQLVQLNNSLGQTLWHEYDNAGQLVHTIEHTRRLDGGTLQRQLTYTYDFSGRKLGEKIIENGVMYQDNHMAYDELGRLRWVGDDHSQVLMTYDAVGNRTSVYTHVINNEGLTEYDNTSTRYFLYDAMNRQVVVDAINAAGIISPQQGHYLAYDLNGNRVSDRFVGRKVTANVSYMYDGESNEILYDQPLTTFGLEVDVEVEEKYRYDGMDRLASIERNGIQMDRRMYDKANRVVSSGSDGDIPVDYVNKLYGNAGGNGMYRQINLYNTNGQLKMQEMRKSDGALHQRTFFDHADGSTGYDGAGNLVHYRVSLDHNGGEGITYNTDTQARFGASYKERVVRADSTRVSPDGIATSSYDAGGFMYAFADSATPVNNRSFVGNANGQVIATIQGDKLQRQLIVNGEVLGRYGSKLGNSNIADFNFGYKSITPDYPSATPGTYVVRSGDTLKSIAQAAYGDSRRWYQIAEANGLASDNELRVGQTLNLPNLVGTAHNADGDYLPYDPSKIVGDTTPTAPLPPPKKKSWLAQLLIVIVAVIVAVVTQQWYVLNYVPAYTGATIGGGLVTLTSATAAEMAIGTVIGGAIGGAAGSIASQAVGMALGVQDSFSWKGVALGAISGGVSAGLGGVGGQGGVDFTGGGVSSLGNRIIQGAVGNALTQGIGVVTGLQDKFSWRAVAASAASAGVGQAVGGALKDTNFHLGDFGNQLARGTLSGLAAGTTAAAMRGGRVSIQQVATDAFGNALGSSIAEGSSGVSNPAGAANYRNGMDIESDNFHPASAYGYRNGADIQSDAFHPASAYGYRNGLDVQSDAFNPATLANYRNGMDVASDNFNPATLGNYKNGMDVASDQATTARQWRERMARAAVSEKSREVNRFAAGAQLNSAPYNSTAFAGRSTITDPEAYLTTRQRDARAAAMSNEPAESYSASRWKAEALDYKLRQGKSFNRDSIYNGLWTKGAQLDFASGNYNDDALNQAAGVGVEAGAHADMGLTLARGVGSGIGRVMSAIGGNRPNVTTPVIGSGVPPQGGVDLELKYKEGWTAEQRAAADAKVRFLTEAPTVVTPADRSGTSSAMSRYRKTESLPSGVDVDHMQDLQLGGSKGYENLGGVNASVNRSLGVQIQQQIKNLPIGTQINRVTIRD